MPILGPLVASGGVREPSSDAVRAAWLAASPSPCRASPWHATHTRNVPNAIGRPGLRDATRSPSEREAELSVEGEGRLRRGIPGAVVVLQAGQDERIDVGADKPHSERQHRGHTGLEIEGVLGLASACAHAGYLAAAAARHSEVADAELRAKRQQAEQRQTVAGLDPVLRRVHRVRERAAIHSLVLALPEVVHEVQSAVETQEGDTSSSADAEAKGVRVVAVAVGVGARTGLRPDLEASGAERVGVS